MLRPALEVLEHDIDRAGIERDAPRDRALKVDLAAPGEVHQIEQLAALMIGASQDAPFSDEEVGVRVEGERARVDRHQHEPPSRGETPQPVETRRRVAREIDDHVHATASRCRKERVAEAAAIGRNGRRAERLRELELGRNAIDGVDLARTEDARQLHRRHAEAAEADDGYGVVVMEAAEAEGVIRGGRRAHHHRRLRERHLLRDRDGVRRRYDDPLREAAVPLLADHLPIRAELFAVAAARRAFAAGEEVMERDAIADECVLDVGSEIDDHARHFVPECDRKRRPPDVGPVMCVAVTDAGGADLDDDLARTGDGIVDRRVDEWFLMVKESDGAHGSASYGIAFAARDSMKRELVSARSSGTFQLGGDLPVQRLGFGAMRITGKGVWGPPEDKAECLRVLRRAVDLDINVIDTADSYGPYVSEELIAEALHPYPQGLVIATKAGFERSGPGKWEENGRPAHLRKAVDGSLKRLRVERIDLWQLHRIDKNVAEDDQFGTIADLQRAGKIRHVGLSEVNVDQIERARRYFAVVSVQNRYNLADRAWEEVLEYCERENIGFIPWYPLQTGKLADGSGPLAKLARKRGVTPAQIALAWLLRRSPVMLPIPGTSKVDHLEENVAAAGLDLSEEEFGSI